MLFRFMVWLIFVIPLKIIYPSRVIGRRKFRTHKGKGIVVVCNHKSFADVPLLFCAIPRKVHFLAHGRLFERPFHGWFFNKMLGYPVHSDNTLSVIRHSVNVVKNKNEALLIFPEGMRVFNDEDALELRNGSSMIAIKTGAPVVPIVMNRFPSPLRFTKIKVGDPISTSEFEGKATKEQLSEFSAVISEAMKQLLVGFEKIPKVKKQWESIPADTARGIVIKRGTRKNKRIRNNNVDKILLIKRTRSDARGNEEIYYTTPGGFINEVEGVRDCVRREIFEETGVTIEPRRVLYKRKHHVHGKLDDGTETRKEIMESYIVCDYIGGRISTDTGAEEYETGNAEKPAMDGAPRGEYEPMWVPLAQALSPNFPLLPMVFRDNLRKDIAWQTTRLAKRTKFLTD